MYAFSPAPEAAEAAAWLEFTSGGAIAPASYHPKCTDEQRTVCTDADTGERWVFLDFDQMDHAVKKRFDEEMPCRFYQGAKGNATEHESAPKRLRSVPDSAVSAATAATTAVHAQRMLPSDSNPAAAQRSEGHRSQRRVEGGTKQRQKRRHNVMSSDSDSEAE